MELTLLLSTLVYWERRRKWFKNNSGLCCGKTGTWLHSPRQQKPQLLVGTRLTVRELEPKAETDE